MQELDPDREIQKTCIEWVKAGIVKDAKERFDTNLFQTEVFEITKQRQSDFEAFWLSASTDGKFAAEKFAALLKSANITGDKVDKVTLGRMAKADNQTPKTEIEAMYKLLKFRLQRRLAGRKEMNQ